MTTDKLISDIRSIIEQGRQQAYAAANQITVLTYWHIGRRIVEEEQHGKARAQYGTRLIKTLAEQLMPKYGSTFSKRNLDYFRQFYLCFNDLEIVNTRVHNLTWSHFRSIIQIADPKAREWYVNDENDNPTIGILLCTETDKVLAKYSVLNGSEQLFAAKYMAYMPTEEELSREIEQQKRFFLEQHGMEE